MSTRATYTIKQSRHGEIYTQNFYIHYDGYPEGAAVYFYNMIAAQNQGRGGLLFAFIRGNELVEMTNDPKAHADREFHYEIDADRKVVTYWSKSFEDKEMIFEEELSIVDFINTFYDKEVTTYENGYIGEQIVTVHELTEAMYVKEQDLEKDPNNQQIKDVLNRIKKALGIRERYNVKWEVSPRILEDYGWGNGYIIVDENHPLYKKQYDEINGPNIEGIELTYSNWYGGNVDGKWKIGFATHSIMNNYWTERDVVNKTLDLKEWAEQL